MKTPTEGKNEDNVYKYFTKMGCKFSHKPFPSKVHQIQITFGTVSFRIHNHF